MYENHTQPLPNYQLNHAKTHQKPLQNQLSDNHPFRILTQTTAVFGGCCDWSALGGDESVDVLGRPEKSNIQPFSCTVRKSCSEGGDQNEP